jgi:hypothetical protein
LRKRIFEDGAFDWRALLEILVDLGVDSVEEAWHRAKYGWLELLHVVDQLLDVTLVEADLAAHHEDSGLGDTLEHVGEREIGEVPVIN